MDFTFARFALNMAMASSRTEPEVMLKAGAPAFLVGMISNPNELVRWGTFSGEGRVVRQSRGHGRRSPAPQKMKRETRGKGRS